MWCLWCGVFGVRFVMRKTFVDPDTPRCVDSKRPRVHRHHVHMYATCGPVAAAHGGGRESER